MGTNPTFLRSHPAGGSLGIGKGLRWEQLGGLPLLKGSTWRSLSLVNLGGPACTKTRPSVLTAPNPTSARGHSVPQILAFPIRTGNRVYCMFYTNAGFNLGCRSETRRALEKHCEVGEEGQDCQGPRG